MMALATAAAQQGMPQGLPDPNHFSSIGWVLLCLFAIMGIVKLGLDLWKDHFREEPRPAGTYATITHVDKQVSRLDGRIDECHKHHQKGDEDLETDIKTLGQKIDEVRSALQSEGSRRAASLHGRMDSMQKELSAVSERSESTQAELRLANQNIMKVLTEVRK